MKKIISLLLTLVMLTGIISVVPFSASALSATYGDFQCTVENGNCTITKYVGTGTVVEVPKTVNGFKVVELGVCAFQYNKDVTKVTLPNTIKKIGGSAFSGCKSLKSITIPKSVEHIGNWCFSSCENLETVTLNEGLKKIDGNAFENCYSLTSIRLPDSLEEASYNLFKNCKSLKSVYIGANCGNIEGNCKYPGARYAAFGDAYNVEKITISSKNKYYSSQDGVWYDKNKTMIMYYPPAKKDSEYTVPLSVTTIPFRGIYGTSYLKKIRISSNVTSIGTHGFGYGPRNGTSFDSDPYTDLVVAGYSGTIAHEYAFNNGFTFEQLDKPKTVTLNKTTLTINGNPTYQLKATVNPSTALTDLTWSSSNSKVVKVNGYGKITAKASGKATITVKTFNGKKATCVVTVKAPSKVKLNKTAKTLSKKKTVTLTAKVSGGKDNALKWTTSNKNVAKITKVSNTKYKVTALKKGTAKITVKTYNGKKSVCTIKVK